MAQPLSVEDSEHLRLLSSGHYVMAGLQAVFGCLPVLHLVMGIWMLTSPQVDQAKDGPPAAFFGAFFVAIAGAWIITSWALAGCLVVAGRSLVRRKRRTFCFVVSAVTAMLCMPFGTMLGLFTIIVLLRPAVRDAFEPPPSPAGSVA